MYTHSIYTIIVEMKLKVPAFLRLTTRKPEQIGHIETLQGRDLAEFLSDFGPEELRGVREIWKKYAAHKGLIDFEAADGETKIRP